MVHFFQERQSTDVEHLTERDATSPALATPLDDESYSVQSVTPRTATPSSFEREPQPKRKKKLSTTDEVIQLAGQQLKNMRPDDEFEAYGKYIAHKLRSLKGNQAVFARKLINDVIFEGELETLNKDFKVTNSEIIANNPQHLLPMGNHQQFYPQMIPQQPYSQTCNPQIPDNQPPYYSPSSSYHPPTHQQPRAQPSTEPDNNSSNIDFNHGKQPTTNNTVSAYFSKFLPQ